LPLSLPCPPARFIFGLGPCSFLFGRSSSSRTTSSSTASRQPVQPVVAGSR
jgi:hypothetical protein